MLLHTIIHLFYFNFIYPPQSLSWYVQLRPEELGEIDFLKKDATVTVKGPVEETPGKVIFLI